MLFAAVMATLSTDDVVMPENVNVSPRIRLSPMPASKAGPLSPPPLLPLQPADPSLFPGSSGIGAVVTLTVAIPSTPPARAFTSAVPHMYAVKRPALSMVPMAASEHDQATLTQSIPSSRWSKTVATNSRISPGAITVFAGSIAMVAGTAREGSTVTRAEPDISPAVAVRTTLSSLRAAKRPESSMVPICGSLLSKATATPGISSPY